MRKLLLITLGIVFCARMSYGQAGLVGVYGDPAGTLCKMTEPPPGYYNMTTYVVHVMAGPTTGVGFKVVPSYGWTASVAISQITAPFIAAGDPLSGTNVGYLSCITATPILIATIIWNSAGTGDTCAYLSVEDNPATTFQGVEVNDCALPYGNSLHAPDTWFFINPDGGWCDYLWCSYDPTLKRTWGKIKALYN